MLLFFRKKSRVPYPGQYPIVQKPGTEPNVYQKEQTARRFGMFLHFGINTFHNTEWSDGTLPVSGYKPTGLDVDSWVRTAYLAGMNYIIIITKHHDGFCLWNTDTTAYSIKQSACPTDIVAEAARACQKYGLKLGLYYSLWDRHEACYADHAAYAEYMNTQLTELMDGRYGEIAELWLDGSWDKSCRNWHLDRLYNTVKSLQPQCQIGVNITVGKYSEKSGNPRLPRYQPEHYKAGDPLHMFPSDFRLFDPHLCREDDPKLYTFNGQTYYLPFEQTLCSRGTPCWFYSDGYEKKPLKSVKELERCYKILEKTDNLMVINLPPNKDGKLVQGDVDNLMRLADALHIRRSLPENAACTE